MHIFSLPWNLWTYTNEKSLYTYIMQKMIIYCNFNWTANVTNIVQLLKPRMLSMAFEPKNRDTTTIMAYMYCV